MKKTKLTALEKSWILYDIGNSAFTLLVSTLIPIYFNSLAGSAGVNEDMYLSYWGYAGSISTVLVAIIAPICGTLSDRNFKKPIFLLTVILGCVACAAMGVPTVLLAGDKMLTEDSQGIHPKLKTVAVKDGFGGSTRCLNPGLTCKMIREQAEAALKQELGDAGVTLPEKFVFEVAYKEHRDAVRRSFFPGCRLEGDRTVVMETRDFMDVLRAVQFIL